MSLFLLLWVIFSERLTDTSCPGFFSLFFGISLAVVKTGCEMSYWIVFFSRNGLPLFVFDLCHICLLSASWVLFLKRKVSILYSVSLCLESYIRIFSELDMALCWNEMNEMNIYFSIKFSAAKKIYISKIL